MANKIKAYIKKDKNQIKRKKLQSLFFGSVMSAIKEETPLHAAIVTDFFNAGTIKIAMVGLTNKALFKKLPKQVTGDFFPNPQDGDALKRVELKCFLKNNAPHVTLKKSDAKAIGGNKGAKVVGSTLKQVGKFLAGCGLSIEQDPDDKDFPLTKNDLASFDVDALKEIYETLKTLNAAFKGGALTDNILKAINDETIGGIEGVNQLFDNYFLLADKVGKSDVNVPGQGDFISDGSKYAEVETWKNGWAKARESKGLAAQDAFIKLYKKIQDNYALALETYGENEDPSLLDPKHATLLDEGKTVLMNDLKSLKTMMNDKKNAKLFTTIYADHKEDIIDWRKFAKSYYSKASETVKGGLLDGKHSGTVTIAKKLEAAVNKFIGSDGPVKVFNPTDSGDYSSNHLGEIIKLARAVSGRYNTLIADPKIKDKDSKRLAEAKNIMFAASEKLEKALVAQLNVLSKAENGALPEDLQTFVVKRLGPVFKTYLKKSIDTAETGHGTGSEIIKIVSSSSSLEEIQAIKDELGEVKDSISELSSSSKFNKEALSAVTANMTKVVNAGKKLFQLVVKVKDPSVLRELQLAVTEWEKVRAELMGFILEFFQNMLKFIDSTVANADTAIKMMAASVSFRNAVKGAGKILAGFDKLDAARKKVVSVFERNGIEYDKSIMGEVEESETKLKTFMTSIISSAEEWIKEELKKLNDKDVALNSLVEEQKPKKDEIAEISRNPVDLTTLSGEEREAYIKKLTDIAAELKELDVALKEKMDELDDAYVAARDKLKQIVNEAGVKL